MRYYYALKAYLTLAFQVIFTSRHYTNKLVKELYTQLNLPPNSLSPLQIKRIRFYILQAIIVADWISTLRNTRTTKTEIKWSIYIGALTPILDDLTDELHLTSSQILHHIETNENTIDTNLRIARYLLLPLRDSHNDYFKQILTEGLQAQDRSLRQLGKERLSNDELQQITKDKGGLPTLLYALVLNGKLVAGEYEAITSLGYALQQVNDMFDIYKDHQNGIQTLFTNSTDLYKNYHTYQQTMNEVIARFSALTYKRNNIQQCLIKVSTILGRGMVCMHQLRLLQDATPDTFIIDQCSRKQLVCDMEKPRNMFLSVKYSLQLFNMQTKEFKTNGQHKMVVMQEPEKISV